MLQHIHDDDLHIFESLCRAADALLQANIVLRPWGELAEAGTTLGRLSNTGHDCTDCSSRHAASWLVPVEPVPVELWLSQAPCTV